MRQRHAIILHLAIGAVVCAAMPALAVVNDAAEAARSSATGFYAVVATMLVVTGGVAGATRQRSWVPYPVLALMTLGWFALAEQSAARIFSVRTGIAPEIVLATGAALSAISFAVAALGTRRETAQARYRRVFWRAAALALCIIPLPWFAAEPVAALSVWLAFTSATLGHLVAAKTFPQFGRGSDRYNTVGMVAFVLAMTTCGTLITLNIAMPELRLFLSNRVIIFIFVTLGGALAFQRVLATTKERERALSTALDTALRDAQTNRALLEAERNYAEAREVARTQSRRLATASHDIKQPLMSLRSLVDAATTAQPEAMREDLRRAFDYLEGLASSYIDGHGENPFAAVDDSEGSMTESATASMFVATLDRMFRSEAANRGIAFETSAVATQVTASPLHLMRILSNLLSNAIKHTETGLVRLEAIDAAPNVSFRISNSGPALDDAAVLRLKTYGTKDPASDGTGLGLAIVEQLAEEQGMTLDFAYDPESGTNQFSVAVPMSAG